MPRRSTKKFEFANGVYYFNIQKGYNNNITINRKSKLKAIEAFQGYMKTQKGNVEWLGKWDGSKFKEDNFEKLIKA
jgi:hypothetical protein